MDQYVTFVSDLLTDPKYTRWTAPCAILAEAVLCGLIRWKVPYTEIDYTTYLHQVSHFLSGERHYAKLIGPSGPLVYPAVHVYIYSALHRLTAVPSSDPSTPANLLCAGNTDCKYGLDVDIQTAQLLFAGLYLVTLAVVIACYRRAGAPTWLFVPLVLSKRLHSIFMLRLFNDGWATLFFWLSVHSFQRKRWAIGAILWSLGVGVKMTVLLAAPAVGVILVQVTGLVNAVGIGAACGLLHILLASPFLGQGMWLEYFSRAFQFSRQFLFKWTVNWRFVGEEIFTSRQFAFTLLVLHVSLLAIFLDRKWVRPSSNGVLNFMNKWMTTTMSKIEQVQYAQKITPTFVMDTMLGSMAIGLLCARSLHYQFYAYLGWVSPYLLWRTGWGPVWIALNMISQETCWLAFPSTSSTSAQVVLYLLIQVVCVFMAPAETNLIANQPSEPT